MIPRLLLTCSLAFFAGPLAAQATTGRWSLQVRGEVLTDRGDLRIDSLGGRVLLESQDDRWIPLRGLQADSMSINFEVGNTRRYTGTVTDDLMSGQVFEGARAIAAWEARRIQAGVDRWPVRPRLTVRQVLTGKSDTVARFAQAWYSRILTREALVAEHAALARDAGFAQADIGSIAARSQRTMLGFDADARQSARRLLEQIATSPAADATFRGLFTLPGGGWRLDLHEVAWQLAGEAQGRPVDVPGLLRGLDRLGVRADSASVVHATWMLWGRHRQSPEGAALLSGLLQADTASGQPLRPLLSGYDSAEQWWREAVQWLMHAQWIETAAGWRSPVNLVAEFWDRDTLVLPVLETRHFGTVQAVPVIGVDAIASLLLQPENAIAAEWLAEARHRDQALTVWRGMEQGEEVPLRLSMGDRSLTVASAAQVARTRLGGFLAGKDAIRIEPAIMPVFAVGTVVHEWQHLLFESARLRSDPPLAFRDMPWGMLLVEADPWLGEGAAEWATEAVFLPAREMTPLFALMELEKRLGIGAGIPDDTHVLGYLLVRAAVNRVGTHRALRQILERHLHDPAGFAEAIGLSSTSTHGIPRPSTLMLIPEVTFTFDGGVADHVMRRVVVPDSTEES